MNLSGSSNGGGEGVHIFKSCDISLKIRPLCMYRIAPNFRGTKFSQISLLQIFAEINFVDQGFPLATPRH